MDYYQKMTRYIEIISNPARAIDPTVSARTYVPVESADEESVFHYIDSASSRAGITGLAGKLAMNRVAIIGLGGTGSYVLDLVAKSHVREIHLYDGDVFLQHNAFRAPGAPSLDILQMKPAKVVYYADVYGKMRRGVISHEIYIDEETVGQLAMFDFVFLCIDKPTVRKLVSGFLIEQKIPFIDAGMNLELLEDQECLVGLCRVTLCTPDMSDHFSRHVSLGEKIADDLYGSNIQVADLNSMNAAMAVIKWKKYCGFYQDCRQEHQSAYAINAHALTRDEMVEV
jgi:hypothetical protein